MEEDGGCLGTGWSGGGGLLLILKLHEVLQSSLLGVSVSPFLHFFLSSQSHSFKYHSYPTVSQFYFYIRSLSQILLFIFKAY